MTRSANAESRVRKETGGATEQYILAQEVGPTSKSLQVLISKRVAYEEAFSGGHPGSERTADSLGSPGDFVYADLVDRES